MVAIRIATGGNRIVRATAVTGITSTPRVRTGSAAGSSSEFLRVWRTGPVRYATWAIAYRNAAKRYTAPITATTPATPAKSAGYANPNTLENPSSAAGRSRHSINTVARPKFARNA